MTFNRREVLGTLGVASAQAMLWAFGCAGRPPPPRRAPQVSQDVRTWLHDAVARLAVAYPAVHALAISRRRTTAALDVLGPGTGRLRADGAVLSVRLRDGSRREYATSELTAEGIAAAAEALAAGAVSGATHQRGTISFGHPPATPPEPPHLDERDLHDRLAQLQRFDARRSSRIVYAAALLDIDDTIVWSVAPGRDLEQRLVRIRQSITRAAWNGARPVVAEAERAWSGWLDDQTLGPADLAAADEAALKLMTPGSFDDGERIVLLDPSVAALLLDAAASSLLTAAGFRGIVSSTDGSSAIGDTASSSAASAGGDASLGGASPSGTSTNGASTNATSTNATSTGGTSTGGTSTGGTSINGTSINGTSINGTSINGTSTSGASTSGASTSGASTGTTSVHGSVALGRTIASPVITLIDDPTAPGAYGGFAFDDEGQPAAPLTLIDAGRVAAQLAASTGRARRPGHLDAIEPSSSHLQLVPGHTGFADLYSDGLVLEGGLAAAYDPASDRIRITCARARELTAGHATGRIYADVELVGSLTALLAATDAVASEPAARVLGSPIIATAADAATAAGHRATRWRSIATPALRTRGTVRARRFR